MKHTKILATISDRRCDVGFIRSLHEKGMNAVRINTAHQNPKDTLKVIANVRKVSDKIPIIIDTKGPEVRTDGIEETIKVKKGEKIRIGKKIIGKEKENKEIANKEIMNKDKKRTEKFISTFCTNYPKLIEKIKIHDHIFIDDGSIELRVISKKKDYIECIAKDDGEIKNKKSINVPGRELSLPTFTGKDLEYINLAIDNDIDFIAHSFVRDEKDVKAIQKILDKRKSRIKIIAKIENEDGVKNIDKILQHVYGIMIARGDLAVEVPAHTIPRVQKEIVKKCIKKKKIVITATQMLHSMIDSPRPTRAEVSDVANAVYDGTDVLMLSGETASGKYPEEAVSTMATIAKEGETDSEFFRRESMVDIDDNIATFLSHSAINASEKLQIKAIIADTLTGRTARALSAFRGNVPIYVQCYDKRVVRELGLSYGIRPEYSKPEKAMNPRKFIKKAIEPLIKKGKLDDEDLILVLAGSFGPSHGASFIEISKIKNIL